MDKNKINISILGAGKLSWHLAEAIADSGIIINEIYSRNLKSAKKLVEKILQGKATTDKDFTKSSSDIFILALPDDVIPVILDQFQFPKNALILHTSGMLPISIFKENITNNGVLYPLQTFSFDKAVNFKEIPICIEASNEESIKKAESLAKIVSDNVIKMASEKRKILHLAAVFACNFSNHLLVLSKEILNSENIQFILLKSLVTETINKAFEIGPENAQTGPAIRNDQKTMQAHMQSLENDIEKLELYKILTSNIINFNENKRPFTIK